MDKSNSVGNNNIQYLGAAGMHDTYTNYGGGGGLPVARGDLDFQRMGVGQTPEATYPDGYLGTIRSRRDDRLLDSLKSRVGQKAYQRGVHKGERIDVGDYIWPMELSPMRGLENQARGMRTTIVDSLTPPPHLVNDGKANMVATSPGEINERRAAQMSRMRPTWR